MIAVCIGIVFPLFVALNAYADIRVGALSERRLPVAPEAEDAAA